MGGANYRKRLGYSLPIRCDREAAESKQSPRMRRWDTYYTSGAPVVYLDVQADNDGRVVQMESPRILYGIVNSAYVEYGLTAFHRALITSETETCKFILTAVFPDKMVISGLNVTRRMIFLWNGYRIFPKWQQ